MCFSAYNIASTQTKDDILDGSVNIILNVAWVTLGLSANKIAFKLFTHKKFRGMLRLHSKTFLKLNAAAVVLLLFLMFIIVNNINSYIEFADETCTKG